MAATAFSYRAVDGEGRVHAGTLDAADATELEQRLGRLGFELVSLANARPLRPARRLLRRDELVHLCFHLNQLLRAGVPLMESLAELRQALETPRLRQCVAQLEQAIEAGQPLSGAMAAQPRAFDAVFVALVRAGEESGRLPEALDLLADNLRWRGEMTSQARRALLYPAITFAVVIVALVLLLAFLVPPLANTLRSLSPSLPRETEFLLAASRIAANAWPALVMVPAVAAGAVTVALRSSAPVRRRLAEALLGVPVLGPLRLKLVVARFAATFAMLYRSGIPVLEAVGLCEKAVGCPLIREALQEAGRAIAGGRAISQAFADTQRFPPLALRMLRMGESTGRLDTALLHASDLYRRQAHDAVARLQALVGPVSTLVVGGLIAAVVYAVFLPLYGAIGRAPF